MPRERGKVERDGLPIHAAADCCSAKPTVVVANIGIWYQCCEHNKPLNVSTYARDLAALAAFLEAVCANSHHVCLLRGTTAQSAAAVPRQLRTRRERGARRRELAAPGVERFGAQVAIFTAPVTRATGRIRGFVMSWQSPPRLSEIDWSPTSFRSPHFTEHRRSRWQS